MSEPEVKPEPPPYWKLVDFQKLGEESNMRTYEHVVPGCGTLVLVRSVVSGHVVQTLLQVPLPPPFNFGTAAGGGYGAGGRRY